MHRRSYAIDKGCERVENNKIERFITVDKRYGSDDGSGYGSDDGCGYGYGYVKELFIGDQLRPVTAIDGVDTILVHIHGNIARGYILHRDLSTSACFVVKQDNVFAHGETLNAALEALQNKIFEDMPEDERIDSFLEEFGTENIKYPAKLFFDWHYRLTGSCEMGRKAFACDHGIDIEHDEMTVAEFIELTLGAYGGDTIKKVRDHILTKGESRCRTQ